MAAWKCLWTDAPPPPEYVDLYLCREVYHCTPAELAKQDAETVSKHLVLLDVEAKARERRNAKGAK